MKENRAMKSRHQTRNAILGFLRRYIRDHGYAPSLRDIMKELNLSSVSIAVYHLRSLEHEGKIVRAHNRARAIRLVEKEDV